MNFISYMTIVLTVLFVFTMIVETAKIVVNNDNNKPKH